jgi:parallel beta-helix repeat protein
MKLNLFSFAMAAMLSASLPVFANTYYFSQVRGNDTRTSLQAQSTSTPWQTLNKLNSFFSSLKAGDSVLFERGSVFVGKIIVTRSGTSVDPIVFAAFGSGADPSISGFAAMTGWVSVGSGVWKAPCSSCGNRVNMVSIGDSAQPMGRSPNASAINKGYDSVQSHVGTTSITNSKLGLGPNWAGADLVIRKNRWITERDSITAHNGNTINYISTTTFDATNKFGYFVQDHLKTLDLQGEWYYDSRAKMMNMFWNGSAPTVTVLASTVDTLVSIKGMQYIVFNGIYFQGSNNTSIFFIDASYITMTNCRIRFSGVDGIKGIRGNNVTIGNTTVEYSNNNGIDLDGDRNMIQDSRIMRTGTIPGMGNSSHSYQGIVINGANNTVQYNAVDTTGFNPIVFMGTSNNIKNNLVDYFCYVKDDGGGIYTWAGDIDSATKRTTGWITGNIVVNGLTVPEGTDNLVAGIAHGIYLDENTGVCNLSGNTVAHCTAGLFLQDSHELTVASNTLFDNPAQIILRRAQLTGTLRNNDIYGNIAVSKTDSQNVLVMSSITAGIANFGSFHANKYAQLSSFGLFFRTALLNENNSGNLALWKSQYGQDWNSTQLPLNFPPYTVNQLLGSNLYTRGSIITPFLQTVTGARTIVNSPVGTLLSGTWYVTHFTLHTPDDTRSLLVYLQKYQPPYTHFTPVITIPSKSPSINSTIVFYTTGADPSGAIVFQMNQSDPRVYIDNIDLYRAVVTPNDMNLNYVFQYNASKSAKTIPLSGVYQDISGVTYQTSIQIPAYGSVLLFLK